MSLFFSMVCLKLHAIYMAKCMYFKAQINTNILSLLLLNEKFKQMLASPCVSQPNKQQKSKRPEILWSFIPIPQELFAYTGSIKQAGFMCSTL